jgi:hypothetical protein
MPFFILSANLLVQSIEILKYYEMRIVEIIILLAVLILSLIGVIIKLIQIKKRFETKFELQRKYNKYIIESLFNGERSMKKQLQRKSKELSENY